MPPFHNFESPFLEIPPTTKMVVTNLITGKRQRLPVMNTYRKKRASALDAEDAKMLKEIEVHRDNCTKISMSASTIALQLYFQWMHIEEADIERRFQLAAALDWINDNIIEPNQELYAQLCALDELIGDMPDWETKKRGFKRKRQFQQIDNSIDDNEAKSFTNFTKGQL